jgi:hypothetical protein
MLTLRARLRLAGFRPSCSGKHDIMNARRRPSWFVFALGFAIALLGIVKALDDGPLKDAIRVVGLVVIAVGFVGAVASIWQGLAERREARARGSS